MNLRELMERHYTHRMYWLVVDRALFGWLLRLLPRPE